MNLLQTGSWMLKYQAILIIQVDPTESLAILPQGGEKVDIVIASACVTFKNCP